MITIILAVVALLSSLTAAIALISRHHLRVRHTQAKATLLRVSRERDDARWEALGRPVQ